MRISKSEQLFAQAQQLFPGGVNSPVRAFRAVGGTPRFIDRGAGAYLFDVDGNRYIDFVLSYGPLILGHADEEVIGALQHSAARGTSYGAPHAGSLELARLIQSFMPSCEKIRFVNSGTEAAMSVLRLARAFTAREKIIKFTGCYHGHADAFLVSAGSGVATFGLPDSPGVSASTAGLTLVAPYNDLEAVRNLAHNYGDQLAAIMVEPVAGNMGLILPEPGFLEGLRTICDETGALLIFDEVMTGFRVHLGGAEALFDVRPDLLALGKVIGGGLPVGAYAGRREIMSLIAPEGPVYQAGTLSGNPLAMAAGIATLERIRNPQVWSHFEAIGDQLLEGMNEICRQAGLPWSGRRCGSMFGFFLSPTYPRNWEEAKQIDQALFRRFFHAVLEQGVYFAPSPFEAAFLSVKHDRNVIETALSAISRAVASLVSVG